MRKLLVAILAIAVVGMFGMARVSAAPANGAGVLDALTNVDIVMVKGGSKNGGKGGSGQGMKSNKSWKGGGKSVRHFGGRSHHGWRRSYRGASCPWGFALICEPGGCWCAPRL